MNTKVWGPEAWNFLHGITFSQNKMKNNTTADWDKWPSKVSNILPCIFCRSTMKQYIHYFPLKSNGSMENVQKWFFNLHNFVNFKLDHPVDKKWSDVSKHYKDSFDKEYNQDNIKKINESSWKFLFFIAHNAPPKNSKNIVCSVEKRYIEFYKTLANIHPLGFLKEYLSENPLKGKIDRDSLVSWTNGLKKYSGMNTQMNMTHMKQQCKNSRASKIDFMKHDYMVSKNLVKNMLNL